MGLTPPVTVPVTSVGASPCCAIQTAGCLGVASPAGHPVVGLAVSRGENNCASSSMSTLKVERFVHIFAFRHLSAFWTMSDPFVYALKVQLWKPPIFIHASSISKYLSWHLQIKIKLKWIPWLWNKRYSWGSSPHCHHSFQSSHPFTTTARFQAALGAAAASALGVSKNFHGFTTSPLAQRRPSARVQRVQRQIGHARRGAQHREAREGGAVPDLWR